MNNTNAENNGSGGSIETNSALSNGNGQTAENGNQNVDDIVIESKNNFILEVEDQSDSHVNKDEEGK